MTKCETCKWKNEEDGWAICDLCVNNPELEDRYKPFTNADHIRSLPDDELAKVIMCPYDNDHNCCIPGASCLDCCLKWLQQPCEDSPTVEKG